MDGQHNIKKKLFFSSFLVNKIHKIEISFSFPEKMSGKKFTSRTHSDHWHHYVTVYRFCPKN